MVSLALISDVILCHGYYLHALFLNYRLSHTKKQNRDLGTELINVVGMLS